MEIRTACFFGHRDVTHDIRAKLQSIIEQLITEEHITSFYVGHQGQFDSMVYSVLKNLKKSYPQMSYSVVLAYMPDEHIYELYGEDTIYPEGLETVPKRFAISKRNDWLIAHSCVVVCYVYRTWGGAAKFREKAERKGLRIINIHCVQ